MLLFFLLKAIEYDDMDPVFYSNRAAAFMRKNFEIYVREKDNIKMDETPNANFALADANMCIKLDPKWPKGYERKAAAFLILERYDDAINALKDGLEISPGNDDLKRALERAKRDKRRSELTADQKRLLLTIFMNNLNTNPKYRDRDQDPEFMRKFNLLKENPQLAPTDPEMNEIMNWVLEEDERELSKPFEPTPFFQRDKYERKKIKQFRGLDEGEGDEDETDEEEDVDGNEYGREESLKDATAAGSDHAKGVIENDATDDVVEKTEEELQLEREERQAKKIEAESFKESGNQLYKNKEFQAALDSYDRAIAVDPTNILYYNNKAAVYIERGEYELAAESCSTALSVGKRDLASYKDMAKVYNRLATISLKQNDKNAAVEYYQKAQMENYDAALEKKIKQLKRQIVEDYICPELAVEETVKGDVALSNGLISEAVKHYEEAIKRDPSNSDYYLDLAKAYVQGVDYAIALTHLQKAIAIDGKDPKCHAKAGDVYYLLKEYHKAMDSFRAGLAIDPEDVPCKQGLHRTIVKIKEGSGVGKDPDAEIRRKRAMADPEIQAILKDPVMTQVLAGIAQDPKLSTEALKDPVIKAKMERLVAAGF